MDQNRIIAAFFAVATAVLVWLIGRGLRSRLGEKWSELIGQLVSVLLFAVIAIGGLMVADPDQALDLFRSVPGSVFDIALAVMIVVVAQALGRVAGLFVEAALHGVAPVLASRARLLISTVILGVGIVIALQQVGISTDIILILVAALAFGFALTIALAAGLGSVEMARHVAAGRHVHSRYQPGERVRVGDIDGTIAEIGLATTRVDVSDGLTVDIPNREFIGGVVDVKTGADRPL